MFLFLTFDFLHKKVFVFLCILPIHRRKKGRERGIYQRIGKHPGEVFPCEKSEVRHRASEVLLRKVKFAARVAVSRCDN